MKKSTVLAALGAGLFACGLTAHAQTVTPWSVKLGYNYIRPDVDSGDLSAPSLPGTKIDVGGASAPIVSFAYAVTPTWGVELVIGSGYTHKIYADGAIAGAGKLGEVDAYPPSLFLTYHLLDADSRFRPFVGAGLTYAFFRNFKGSATLNGITGGSPSNPTTMDIDSALGYTIKAGLAYNITPAWFVEGTVGKTFIKTTATLSTGQKIDLKLDPLSVNFSLGYRF